MQTLEQKNEISRWASEEVRFVHRKETLEAEVGAAMLDAGPDASTVSDERLARVLTELRGCEEAIKAARQRRLEALQAKRAAEIQAVQNRRADLAKEQEALSAKVEKHRKALVDCLDVEITIMNSSPGRFSKLQALGLQIGGLDEKTLRLQEPFPDFGTLDVSGAVSIDTLLDAVAAFEGIIPPMASVLEWAKACEPVPGETFGDVPRAFHLVWAQGEIDRAQSNIFVEAFCRPGPIGTYSNRPVGLDLQSGTFRANRPVLKPAVF